jgi:very-short-patch-repair endonuclease
MFVHETDRLSSEDVAMIGPIRATSAPRTLLDLAAAGHPLLEKTLDQAFRQRHIRPNQLLQRLEDPEMCGRKGSRALADLVNARVPGRMPSHSELEDLFSRIVRRHRLPQPRGQWPIPISNFEIHADFAYPDCKIAIECDSHTWHTDRLAFDRDRERDAELQALGWVVLRFTWRMLKWRDRYVADIVRRHLRGRRAPTLFAS